MKIEAILSSGQLVALGNLAFKPLGLVRLTSIERSGLHAGAITVEYQAKGPTYSILVVRLDREGAGTIIGERPLVRGRYCHREDAGVLA